VNISHLQRNYSKGVVNYLNSGDISICFALVCVFVKSFQISLNYSG